MSILSDEFVEFSKKILEIKKKYDEEKKSFKDLFLKHKNTLADLEAKAKAINDDWQGSFGDAVSKDVSKE